MTSDEFPTARYKELQEELHQAVQNIANALGEGLVADWVLISAVIPANSGTITTYTYECRSNQPVHTSLGLITVGERYFTSLIGDANNEED